LHCHRLQLLVLSSSSLSPLLAVHSLRSAVACLTTMARNSYLSLVPALVLAAAFLFTGQAKLTPLLTPGVHQQMLSMAAGWLSAFPFLPLTSSQFCRAIGAAEILSAILLILSPLRRLGALIILAVMSGAVYTHIKLNESFLPPAVMGSIAALVWIVSAKPKRVGGGKKHQ